MSLPRLALLNLGLLAFTACGVGADENFDELEALDFDTTVEAISNVNHCAQGANPNATSILPTVADVYMRDNVFCSPAQREMSIVTYNGPNNAFARFVANATFVGITNETNCELLPNLLTFIVQRNVNGSFLEIDNTTTAASWSNGACKVNDSFQTSLLNFSPSGDYRFQAKARRFDGQIQEIQMIGYKTN